MSFLFSRSNKKTKKSSTSDIYSNLSSRSPSPTRAEPSTSPPPSPPRSTSKRHSRAASVKEDIPRRPRPQTSKSESKFDSSPTSIRQSRPKRQPTTTTPTQRYFDRATRSGKNGSHFNEHPLNLPPDELRRLSALSNMSENSPMDVDSSPSSPQAQKDMPGSFATEKTLNGTNGTNDEKAPTPPPHKSAPSSPKEGPTPEEAEAFKLAGNKFFKAKEYGKAIDEYTKAIDALPSSATYLSNRAAAYISAGLYFQALDDCVLADSLDPSNAKILLRLARVYTQIGRPEEALSTYAKIEPSPSAKDIAPAKTMLQSIKNAENALEGSTGSMAIHALDQAERGLGLGAPKPRKWQLMRGEACLKQGNVNALGEAQNVAMNLLRKNQSDPEALVLRGRALYAQGDNEKAIQHFRQALNCDPDFKNAVKWLRLVQKLDRMKAEGNAEYKAGRWQAAVDKYTNALEVDPQNKGTNSKLLQNRALCFVKLKTYEKAIEDCEKALQLDPSYTKARKTKASALGASGNWEESVREWKALAESDPSDASLAKEVRKAELELKKSKRKDYYKILGIEKEASEQEIKKAYRKLAIIHHPDKNAGDEQAAERFKDIGEAYETLSDDQKRAAYDRGDELQEGMMGGDPFGGGMGGGMGGIDPEILMQMFGQGGGRGGGGGFGGFGGGGGGGGFPGHGGGQSFHFG